MEGYIFDLDGVLVDTAKYHYAAWNKLAQSLGFSISEEENENLKGVSRMESLDYILKLGEYEATDHDRFKMAELKNSWYVEMISGMNADELLPGAHELLEKLKKMDKKIGLGSASKNSMKILKSTGILPFFDVVIDGTKTTKSKPDPQVFLMGASALNLPPKSCVVFEDSIKGLQAARQGGFFSVGVGDKETLGDADLYIQGVDQFDPMVLENIQVS